MYVGKQVNSGAETILKHTVSASEFNTFGLFVGLNVVHLVRGLVALDDTAVARNEELGEVPFDVGILVVVGVFLAKHVVQQLAQAFVEIEAAETFLCLQIGIEGVFVRTVHLNFVELWELDVEVSRAELVDFLNGAGCLFAELVAGISVRAITLSCYEI